MAKMTMKDLESFVKTYVAAGKQAGAWVSTTDNLLKLQDKVGKQITLDGSFQDRLPEMSGDSLPLGKTIEEWFIDLTLPSEFDATGADNDKPAYPSVEDVAYCYTLGRKKIKTSEPYDNVERAALTPEDAASMTGKIMERLQNSESLYEFNLKKQLLGNAADKAIAVDTAITNPDDREKYGTVKVVALPSTTEAAENAILEIKKAVEDASFAHQGNCLAGKDALIGASPELTLYVKKGFMPSVEVKAFAGAFQKEELAIPCTIKVVDDIPSTDAKVWGVLVDPRGIKLHTGYKAMRSHENADGDFINYVLHTEFTGFISKYTFVRVFKTE